MAQDEKVLTDAQIEHMPVDGTISDPSKHSMPASLAALSDSEYHKLGVRATAKLDMIIMPCLVLMYILNYLDRQNIAAAKLAGITTDLNLSDTEYQTCVSILFVGYSEQNNVFIYIRLGL